MKTSLIKKLQKPTAKNLESLNSFLEHTLLEARLLIKHDLYKSHERTKILGEIAEYTTAIATMQDKLKEIAE